MRGHRLMQLLGFSLLGLSLLGLAGCGEGRSPARDALSVHRTQPAATGAMEFRGRRPCADCGGIDAWLRLEQEGEVRRYTLVERYAGAGREYRFEERGDWSAEGDLLRLRSDDGGLRAYLRMADHSLHARASDGGPLAAAADDVMTPTTFDNGR